jgi:hypothetical protein
MRTRGPTIAAGALIVVALGALAAAGAEIVVEWTPPPGRRLTAASALDLRPATADPAGTAYAGADASSIAGTIASPGAHFPAQAGHAYDLQLTLDDGTVLQGVNLNWYGLEPPDPAAGPTSEDDRKQILEIVHQAVAPNGFFNHADLLALRGSSERAVALVQLVRDVVFHSGGAGEVIWRVELWYLKNENGGWVKVPQVSRMILRQRLRSHSDFVKALSRQRWVPAMGDVEVGADGAAVRVVLPANAGVAGTASAGTTRPTAPAGAAD